MKLPQGPPLGIGIGLLLVLVGAVEDLALRYTSPPPAAIQVVFRADDDGVGNAGLCESFAHAPGVRRVTCAADSAVYAFRPNAKAEQVATLSFELARDSRVASVLVTISAHGGAGAVEP